MKSHHILQSFVSSDSLPPSEKCCFSAGTWWSRAYSLRINWSLNKNTCLSPQSHYIMFAIYWDVFECEIILIINSKMGAEDSTEANITYYPYNNKIGCKHSCQTALICL